MGETKLLGSPALIEGDLLFPLPNPCHPRWLFSYRDGRGHSELKASSWLGCCSQMPNLGQSVLTWLSRSFLQPP